jgi:hypothetical protein
MPKKSSISEDQLRRVCRMSRTNAQAMRALGLSDGTHFNVLCDRYGIVTPAKKDLTPP